MRAEFGDRGAEGLDDAGIDVEEIVTSHARLSWDAGGDDNHVGSLQGEP